MRVEIHLRDLRKILGEVWWEGHRDVCTDCNCPEEANPYLVVSKGES